MAHQTTASLTRYPWLKLSAGLLSAVMAGLSAPSALAATFSFSGSQVSLRNFSLLPTSQDSNQVTDAIAKTGDGTVDNLFEGLLQFEAPAGELQLNGFGNVRSQGEGTQYSGKASREATVLAKFLVEPSQPFSFDFLATAVLRNTVDQPATESALSLAKVSLQLRAPNKTILQSFDLNTGLNTNSIDVGINDFSQVTGSVPFLALDRQVIPGITSEVNLAAFTGRFEQAVTSPTLLTLVVHTANQTCVQAPGVSNACVSVPEPAPWLWSTIVGLGLVGLSRYRKISSVSTVDES